MSISIVTVHDTESGNRVAEIRCNVEDYLHSRNELNQYIRTGLRMNPDEVVVKITMQKY